MSKVEYHGAEENLERYHDEKVSREPVESNGERIIREEADWATDSDKVYDYL